MLRADSRAGRKYLAELVYMRKLSPEYNINPTERNMLQDKMQFYLNGYNIEVYPADALDNAIYTALHDKFDEATLNNQLIVMNTELRDLQIYRECERGQVVVHISPRLDNMDDNVMLLLDGHTEFNIMIELYAQSVEFRDYFDNMDFEYTDSADGWVEKVIEYRKGMSGYKKLSEVIG